MEIHLELGLLLLLLRNAECFALEIQLSTVAPGVDSACIRRSQRICLLAPVSLLAPSTLHQSQ